MKVDGINALKLMTYSKTQASRLLPKQKHLTEEGLKAYLANKSKWSFEEVDKYSNHLDNCLSCWHLWNKVRWDASLGSQGLIELQEYLGDKYQAYYDSSWAIASEWLREHPKTDEEIANFYKNNQSYLYNLIIWYESGDRADFSSSLMELRNKFNIRTVVDYGCGVGNDGLKMAENDIDVTFIDYSCPSVEFLKWRLNKRNLTAKVIDVEKIDSLPEIDMFWSIDVLEHMRNPLWVVERLSSKTKLFVHRSEFGNDAGGRHPCHFNFDELRLGEALRKRGFKHIPWPILSVWVKE